MLQQYFKIYLIKINIKCKNAFHSCFANYLILIIYSDNDSWLMLYWLELTNRQDCDDFHYEVRRTALVDKRLDCVFGETQTYYSHL